MALLAAPRASRSVSPVSSSEPMTPATSGPASPTSFGQLSLDGASSRTSVVICDWGLEKSPKSFEAWVTRLRQHCGARRKSARHIDESGSSSWPTPNAHDGRRPGHEQGSTQGANLKRSAEQWATPSARDADKWHYREPGHARQVNLSGQASYEAGRQAPRMMRAGEVFPSDSGPRRLNPQFVEWLMGWPAGWTTLVAPTSSEFSATE